MRVISGEFKGRKLKAVPGKNTRPTSDKVKESLFNMIGPYFDGGKCLDLYAGSGALGIEAVSRGMDTAVLVDKQPGAISTIQQNVALTRADNHFTILKKNSTAALSLLSQEKQSFDLVFLDPPYAKQQIEKDIFSLEKEQLLNDQALIVCETDSHTELKEQISHATLWKKTKYGATYIWIYEWNKGVENE